MTLRIWSRLPTTRAVENLRGDIRRLAAAVERLEAVQRKDIEQVKKLRQAVAESTAAWRTAADATDASVSKLRQLVETQRVADRDRILQRIDDSRRVDSKWRKIFNNQLSALVRHICLPLDELEPPFAINARRFRLRSQNEEDGILFALLQRAGWGGRRFVEIGSGKSGGTAGVLAHECGWAGLMIELSPASVESARKKFAGNRHVTVINERITPENVNTVLAQQGYSGEVDLLSIDIDSYDYWVLDALTVTSPRILVLEYNALFGPERRVTIPLTQSLSSTPKGYCGASLAALTELAGRKGYRLVSCENTGVNAFFLRNDVAPETSGVAPTEAFKPLRSRTDVDDAEVATDIYAAVDKRNLPLVEV